LPLNGRFAIGNFIRDEMAGGPIRVRGDGTDVRSYLYASDLAVWLWTILFEGRTCDPYNVGSEQAVSIGETARIVAEVGGRGASVEIEDGPGARSGSGRYVPSTKKARTELHLHQHVELRGAIRRTMDWYSNRRGAETDLPARVA
jgi:dTDP-glucose 4,6-dehydratase